MPDTLPGENETGKAKLLDEVRRVLRRKHYSLRTEEAYVDWIKRFIRHHDRRHPRTMGAEEVRSFLSFLATERAVAASTQNQARSALLFLYKEVLESELPWLGEVDRAKRPRRLPVVLSREEVRRVLAAMSGPYRLLAELLYGTGLRLMEGLRLRVKDMDFEYLQILVRDGKSCAVGSVCESRSWLDNRRQKETMGIWLAMRALTLPESSIHHGCRNPFSVATLESTSPSESMESDFHRLTPPAARRLADFCARWESREVRAFDTDLPIPLRKALRAALHASKMVSPEIKALVAAP